MMPVSERRYSAAELQDARLAGIYGHPKDADGGLLYFATGDGWPEELERRSRKHARLAEAEARLADALRREQDRWP